MLLTQKFFLSDATEVAPRLLGCLLCRQMPSGEIKKGIIIETEAYMQDDAASHSYKGETKRNASMFLEGGTSYVYLIYGMYHCLNVVTGKKGNGQAVLIRALNTSALTSGPGKLCRYLEINKAHDSIIFSPENGIWLEENLGENNFIISCSSRIGISKAKEKNWRFFIEGNTSQR